MHFSGNCSAQTRCCRDIVVGGAEQPDHERLMLSKCRPQLQFHGGLGAGQDVRFDPSKPVEMEPRGWAGWPRRQGLSEELSGHHLEASKRRTTHAHAEGP